MQVVLSITGIEPALGLVHLEPGTSPDKASFTAAAGGCCECPVLPARYLEPARGKTLHFYDALRLTAVTEFLGQVLVPFFTSRGPHHELSRWNRRHFRAYRAVFGKTPYCRKRLKRRKQR